MVRKLKNALRLLLLVPLLLVLTGASGTALADPPARAGRLSVIEGEVALRRDGSHDWESAAVNLPITTGDEIATEADGRAEMRIGSSVLRLDKATSVEVRRLDDERIRVLLKEGSVAMRIRSAEREDAIEVETRDGVAVPAEPGRYRVDFVDAGTLVSNHDGHIDFRTDDRHVGVTEGRRAQIWSEGPTQVVWDEPDEDDFMEWSFARDRRDDRIARNRYVSPEMTGAEDLYEYGDWREYDDYGPVWFPRDVPYGWAPYRYGRWVSIAPWGWTWVDDAPWGFAPFHYGRWVRIRGVWAWVPGRYIARPVYAPALVAWIGTPGVSITYSSGLPNLSWFPLAPREVYVPYYRYSPTYVRQINITHVTNVVEIERVVREPRRVRYAFRDRSEAVTRVSERILRPPKPVALDVERRREHRVREWERRGFPVREVVRPDGTRVRTVQPAQIMQQREERQQAVREQRQEERQQRVESRQERTEALRQQQAREREERAAREQEQQRQRLQQREQQDERREQLRQERRDEGAARKERLEAQRQQNAREREEQVRREAAQQDEQQRQRSVLREQQEQRRDEARRAQREEVEQRQQERQQRLEAQRQQEAGERESRRQQVEQQREERSRQQAQEQERRQQAIRQQTEQREREVQQRQMQIQQQRQAEQQQRQAEQQQRQAERQRVQREPQQDNRRSSEEEQQRRRPPFGQPEGAR
ncbi:DUF6600 domain-containing protein [Aromatoleum petrolei]|uniref:FecR protein domain-containing protein n=1 Tax=Aromatoleum petrolei TaxID=76116 RepID=A0ABX1MUC5_9RHOO|nr:DUF6600 domain-containing protein [Aromatoleum petrolei]NMF89936.1 hypothetical protein [Aromatoleum petrolei]QTQ36431.1 Uncharacterized protein ToN1_22880 [Aromatoleum petrolei]